MPWISWIDEGDDDDPHPCHIISDADLAAVYAAQRYQDELRSIMDNKPFSRPFFRLPLGSTLADA